MIRRLLQFRLYDPSYTRPNGEKRNLKTLSVYLREDNTIGYSFYSDWLDSGTGFSISNLQLKRSLPSHRNQFNNIKALEAEIRSCLSTGVGTARGIKKVVWLNEFPGLDSFSKSDLLGNHDGSFDEFLLNNSSITQEQRELCMELLFEWIDSK